MPNWCSNQIKLGGPTEEIERIWNIIEDPGSDDGLCTALAPLSGEWEYNDALSRLRLPTKEVPSKTVKLYRDIKPTKEDQVLKKKK